MWFLIVFTWWTFWDQCQQKLEHFYLFDPCRAKNLTFDLLNETSVLPISIRWQKLRGENFLTPTGYTYGIRLPWMQEDRKYIFVILWEKQFGAQISFVFHCFLTSCFVHKNENTLSWDLYYDSKYVMLHALSISTTKIDK